MSIRLSICCDVCGDQRTDRYTKIAHLARMHLGLNGWQVGMKGGQDVCKTCWNKMTGRQCTLLRQTGQLPEVSK